ncbi:MAG TPA: alcohol dehydrogenase catalytic domain-containing protein [Chthonomonadales bacterium]|nr:alcohol dehydrogenase catalytic domain-containing protein [Chthonomonadales bacterium]
MRAVRIVDSRKVEVRDLPDPAAEGDEVVVRVEASAICGSDLHSLYEPPGEKPRVPGHETAGVVVAVDRPRRAKVGDRVCLSPARFCGVCDLCRAGYVLYCRASEGTHGFSHDGGHAELIRVREPSLLPLPDAVSFEQACVLLDPIGTPYHGLKRMGTNATHTVGVFGLGPMGLGAVLVAAALGARVVALDPIAYRRGLALKLGAAVALDPNAGDPVAQVWEATGGYGLDRALECSGRPEPVGHALDLVRHLGHVTLIGEQQVATVRPSDHFMRKEITLSGGTCFPLGEYAEIVRWVERGLGPERIITHRFGLESAAEAYSLFAAGQTGKVILTPGS